VKVGFWHHRRGRLSTLAGKGHFSPLAEGNFVMRTEFSKNPDISIPWSKDDIEKMQSADGNIRNSIMKAFWGEFEIVGPRFPRVLGKVFFRSTFIKPFVCRASVQSFQYRTSVRICGRCFLVKVVEISKLEVCEDAS